MVGKQRLGTEASKRVKTPHRFQGIHIQGGGEEVGDDRQTGRTIALLQPFNKRIRVAGWAWLLIRRRCLGGDLLC